MEHDQAAGQRVFLVQTDTTVGFLSQNASKLEAIKSRPPGKPFLKVFSDLKTFASAGGRVPPGHRSTVRRAERTTFVVNGQAFRIVKEIRHRRFLKRYGWMYSTSANQSGRPFDRNFCESRAECVIEDFRGLHERAASSIMRLGRIKTRRLR